MTRTVSIDEAEANLRELLARVEQGDDLLIEREGVAVARVSSVSSRVALPKGGKRRLGIFEGQGKEIDPDWWRPMTDAEVDEWLGEAEGA